MEIGLKKKLDKFVAVSQGRREKVSRSNFGVGLLTCIGINHRLVRLYLETGGSGPGRFKRLIQVVGDARSKARDVLLFRHDAAATGTGLSTPNCLLKIV